MDYIFKKEKKLIVGPYPLNVYEEYEFQDKIDSLIIAIKLIGHQTEFNYDFNTNEDIDALHINVHTSTDDWIMTIIFDLNCHIHLLESITLKFKPKKQEHYSLSDFDNAVEKIKQLI